MQDATQAGAYQAESAIEMILGSHITNRCLEPGCGKDVPPHERQELAYEQESGRFYRRCAECIRKLEKSGHRAMISGVAAR